MTEFIVNVLNEEAELFVKRFGIEDTKLMGHHLTGKIVRCRDCKFKDEPWNCAAPYYVEPDGFCAWGKQKEKSMNLSEYWNDNHTEREFEECGLQCCTRTIDLGHRCGYVALPKGHPLFGKSWDACYDVAPELQVDGGITFARGTDDTWILGWDAAHAWHKRDWSIASDEMRKRAKKHPELYVDLDWPGGSYMVDADTAEAETRQFARQLAELRVEGEGE